MNKVEALKQEKDGLDIWPDLLRYAENDTPIDEIPEADFQRMKWYGVFHRSQRPGTFMLRLRIGGGRLTSDQARAIVHVARRTPHESVDITSRQNIQMRGLVLSEIPEALQALSDAGIEFRQSGMDNVRNVVGCPLAGIDGMELFDSTPVIGAVTEGLLDAGKELSNLPRKVNISLAGCRDDCGHAQSQDLGLVPAISGVDGRRVVGFNVLAGGALGGTSPRLGTPLDVFLTPDEVARFVLAALRVYRDRGPRGARTKTRLKWLIAEIGEEGLRAVIEEELGYTLRRQGSDERLQVAGDHLGINPQRRVGYNYVGLHVPVGRMTLDQLERLADLADTHGSGDIRLTVAQNVALINVPDSELSELLQDPLLSELRPNPSSVWRNLVACTGNDYCHYSLIDTKGHAQKLAAELERRDVQVPQGTRIHVSGCVHACGKHHIADVGIQGTNVRTGSGVEEAADVYTGGRLGAEGRLATKVMENVHVDDMPVLVEALVRSRFQQTVPITVMRMLERSPVVGEETYYGGREEVRA